MNSLSIDTHGMKKTVVSLTVGRKQLRREIPLTAQRSQIVLPLIEELLQEANTHPSQIDAVNVATGPGSFTGLRVGAAVANTLSWLLNVPINRNPPGTIILPRY